MNWDTEIWAPCRLGEGFTLREFQKEHTEYLYSIKADWMGHHGDACSVRFLQQLEEKYPHNVRLGAGPRPWGCCWTYEAKIKITPPVWCWDMQEDTMFGLDLKPKRNGNRRKAKLDCVMIHQGRPVYRMIIETSDGDSHRYYDSIPVLDPYFAPIWPAVGDNNATTEKPAPEPAADPVAAPVTEPAKAEQTPAEAEQTTDSENVADVAILPTPAKCYLTTTNAPAWAAAAMEAKDNPPATWTGAEVKPPGACIGGRLPISGNHYYYVWAEEPTPEGEAYE